MEVAATAAAAVAAVATVTTFKVSCITFDISRSFFNDISLVPNLVCRYAPTFR